MSELLRLEKLAAGYGGAPVIHDISLVIHAGEFCALLGCNGSGKTTLLKAVCGLIGADRGRCLVQGQDCTRFHEHRRARYISYIPQRFSKLQGVCVRDAVLMGRNAHLNVFDAPSPADRQAADIALHKMELSGLAERDFARLSEGQKQMVILARALAQDAPVMLMDEPDSALDFLNRHKMLACVRALIHDEKKAGLVTLHDPNFALAYCDRLILLQSGAVVGELDVGRADAAEITRCLSKIYGEIEVLHHKGKYIMLQR